jgi:hypothetical protein
MSRRATAVLLLSAVVLAACTSTSAGRGRTSTSKQPPPIERGIFIPSRWYTVSDQPPYTVTGRVEGGRMQATARSREATIEISSQAGDPDHDELPARCGDGTVDGDVASAFDPPPAKDGRATYDTTFPGGGAVTVSATNPKVELLHPKSFDTLAATVMAFTFLVDPDTAAKVVAHPTTHYVIERWSHDFDGGIGLQGSLAGTFEKGFHLTVTPTGAPGGAQRDGTDLGGVRCNGPSVIQYGNHVETAFVLFISEGATARVDGTVITDVAYDPNLMGNWAVVTVKDGHPRRVAITDSSGEQLHSVTLTHSDAPSD